MNISQYMRKDLVFLKIHAEDKQDLFQQIVRRMVKRKVLNHADGFVDELMQREIQAPTCIGRGIALPHTRTTFLNSPLIAFARLDPPIPFSENNSDLVEMVFLMGTPKGDPNTYLRILGKLCGHLRDTDFRNSLLEATSQQQVMNLLSSNGYS